MIKIKKLDPTINDERGFLFEIIPNKIRQVNFLFSKSKTIRGNHFHKKLTETFFVLSGKFILDLIDLKSNKSSSHEINEGEYFEIPTYVNHTLKFICDTKMIVCYSDEFDPKNPDIFKL